MTRYDYKVHGGGAGSPEGTLRVTHEGVLPANFKEDAGTIANFFYNVLPGGTLQALADLLRSPRRVEEIDLPYIGTFTINVGVMTLDLRGVRAVLPHAQNLSKTEIYLEGLPDSFVVNESYVEVLAVWQRYLKGVQDVLATQPAA